MKSPVKHIELQDLVIMDDLTDDYPIHIDLAYARNEAPNIFGQIYHTRAKLILFKDLANIVQYCAQNLKKQYGYHLRLYDGLRPIEAQEKMRQSDIVQKNPHWLEKPNRLLSPPGAGGHPRGMAVDLSIQTADGDLLDMGTVFDHLAENPDKEHNPAHRDYVHLKEEAKQNRKILTDSMLEAAEECNIPLLPLPQEWWDFRLPAEIYEQYAPLSDEDLPGPMRMLNPEDY